MAWKMKNGMAYIRDLYGVPAKRGMIVQYKGHRGVITGSKDAYLRVRMEDFDIVKIFHPKDLVFEDTTERAKDGSYDQIINEIINASDEEIMAAAQEEYGSEEKAIGEITRVKNNILNNLPTKGK